MVSSYRKFVTELNQLCAVSAKELLPKCLILHGSEDFFVRSSTLVYCQQWSKLTGGEILRHGDFSDNIDWSVVLGQTGLFSSASLHVFKISDLRRLPALLKKISTAQADTWFCLQVSKDELGKAADQLGAKGKTIGCSVPSGPELRGFIQALAAKHGLKLNAEGADFVFEMIGENFQLLSNEIEKLGLVLSERTGMETGPTDIAPILGQLREDHAFKISDLLLDGKPIEAEVLVRSLLDRGESALAILGILARHFRMIVYHSQIGGKPLSGEAMPRLPSWLRSKYERLAKKHPISYSIRMNRILQQTDMNLKSNQYSEYLAMSKLFSELRC